MSSDRRKRSPVAESPSESRGWTNWSGSVRFTPAEVLTPRSDDDIVAAVRHARDEGCTLRPVGTSHSSSDLYRTSDLLLSTQHLTGIDAIDRARRQAWVRPGTLLKDLFRALREAGLGPPDLGDIAVQTIGGSIATGTHGSGLRLQNLSSMLSGIRLVTGEGQTVEIADAADPRMAALRVSLGALGIAASVRLDLVDAYRLRRQEWFTDVPSCMAHLDELLTANRKMDFYWYPRSDEVKLRILNPPGEGTTSLPWATLVHDDEDWADAIIPKHSGITNLFDEMEYALPADAGPACFEEVRQRIVAKHRRTVGWRVLYRVVAADDADLSTAFGRTSVEISLHQNAGLPWADFFADIEPIFRAHGGRPHWAKKHSLSAEDLKPLYPHWDHFQDVRTAFDPDGVFASPALRRLLGLEDPHA